MVFLMILCGSLVPNRVCAKEPTGTVSGCIKAAVDRPYRGVASLWEASDGRIPDPRKFIIIPSAVASLQPDGCFTLQALPGKYYVGAILRATPGPGMGPPRQGDVVFMTPGVDGGALLVDVVPSQVVDIGVQSDSWRYDGFSSQVEMGVRGQVIDVEEQPVAGLLVFAFADSEVTGAPLAVSERTTQDGSFELRLDRAGAVYLRAKEDYGHGTPIPGGYVGVYGGKNALPITIKPGEVVEQARIIVLQVPEEMTGKLRNKEN